MDKTILLVDDVNMFIEIQKEFLKFSCAEILTATDGEDALNVVTTRRPDLVFMDLQMPKMDGAACCRAIKSDHRLMCIPVVMVTSKGKEEDVKNCFSAGCDDFLTKPLDRDHFLETARRFLPNIDRREKRLPLSVNGAIKNSAESMSCLLHDISLGGAFVITDYFGIPGNVIQISFTLPDGTLIECPGRIVWVNSVISSIPRGFGVKFSLVASHAKEALARFIKASK
jgi:CheY-like chemotaxis protein